MKKVELNIRISGILVLLLIGVIVFLWVDKSGLKGDIAELNETLANRDTTIVHYSIEVDGLKERVSESITLVVARDRALKRTEACAERLKALNIRRVKVIGDLELQIAAMQDSLAVVNPATTDTIEVIRYVENRGDTLNVVEVPLEFEWSNQHARSWAAINERGFGASGFEIYNLDMNIVMGSRGWLKPQSVVSVSSTNPYLHITKQNFVVVESKSRRPFWISLGAVSGGVVTYFLVK